MSRVSGAGALRGVVENVPLTCGSVRTVANLYIGESVPFDLLLGRPWQRGNYVSIDERGDGMYLLFKNQDLETQHEIFVAPDGGDATEAYEPGNVSWTIEQDQEQMEEGAKTLTCTLTEETGDRAGNAAKSDPHGDERTRDRRAHPAVLHREQSGDRASPGGCGVSVIFSH